MTNQEVLTKMREVDQIISTWPAWKRNILVHSASPTVSVARTPVNNFEKSKMTASSDATPPLVMPLLKLLAIDDLDATDAIFWRCDGEYAPISFFIRCNDVFHWGCADAEPVTLGTLPVLRQAFEDCKKAEPVAGVVLAPDLYCARIRKMRPQFAYFRNIGREIKLLFEAAGPERE